jgi:hypothetical protein
VLSGEAPNTKSMLWADQVCIYKPTGYVLMSRAGMYLWADRVCIYEPTGYVFVSRPDIYWWADRVCIHEPTGYVFMSRPSMYSWSDPVCIHCPAGYELFLCFINCSIGLWNCYDSVLFIFCFSFHCLWKMAISL